MKLREGMLLLAPEGLDDEPPCILTVASFTKAKKRKAILIAQFPEFDLKVKLKSDTLPDGWETIDNSTLAKKMMQERRNG